MRCYIQKNPYCYWRPPIPHPIPKGSGTLRIIVNTIGSNGTFDFNINPPANGTERVSITTTDFSGSLDLHNVLSGNYTITAIPQAGWSGTDKQIVFVPINGTGIATFVNTTLGTLVINKVTIGGETGIFNFVVTLPTIFTNISVVNNFGSVSIPNLPTGSYSVIEFSTPGWSGPLIETTFIPPGGTGTVTFVNTVIPYNPGTLIINKTALGGDDTFSFSIFPNIGNLGIFSITTTGGTGSFTIDNVTPGTYTIIEFPISGWETQLANVVNVPNGSTSIANIINSKLGTLIIDKTALGGNSTFNYIITPSPSLGSTGSYTNFSITTINSIGSYQFQNVIPGSYHITELTQTGWIGTTGIDIIVPPGETKTGIFTNAIPGTLTINKISVGSDGTFEYIIETPNGSTGFASITTTNGIGNFSLLNVYPGVYHVNELSQTGWTGPTGIDITVPSGGIGISSFTNIGIGSLIINKTSIGGTGTFDYIIETPDGNTGSASITTTGPLGGTGYFEQIGITAGIYHITELSQTGWIGPTGIDITVVPGEASIGSFINVGIGSLIINKISIGGTGTFEYIIEAPDGNTGTFSITTIEGTGVSEQMGITAGIYHITELSQTGWTGPTGIDITVPPGGIGGASFTNIGIGSLIINKTSIGGTGTFEYIIETPDGNTGSASITTTGPLGETGTGTFTQMGITAGIYHITELSQTGWIGSTGIDVTVIPGEAGIGSFINVGIGSLIINKTSIGGTGTFEYIIEAPDGSSGTVFITTTGPSGGTGFGSFEQIGVTAGIYHITELSQTGWTGSTGIDIIVFPGGTGSETFTNIGIGTLIIEKHTTSDDGSFDYIIEAPDGSTGSTSIITTGGTGSTTLTNIITGFYHISELSQAGWTGQTDIDIIIIPGQTGMVTFTNTPIGTLIINKTAVGGNNTFEYVIETPDGNTGTISISTTGGTGSISLSGVTAGTYYITELSQTGWTGTTDIPFSIEVPINGTGNIEFNNNKLGSITVLKSIINGGNDTFPFILTYPSGATAGLSITTSGSTGSGIFTDLINGIYTLEEIVPSGWSVINNNPINISLSIGEDTSTTFINSQTA